jgi:hypothetical protein
MKARQGFRRPGGDNSWQKTWREPRMDEAAGTTASFRSNCLKFLGRWLFVRFRRQMAALTMEWPSSKPGC